MKTLKSILKKLFCLPPWLVVLVSVPSFALVAYVLLAGNEGSALAYASYVLSAYGLTVVVISVVQIVLKLRQNTEEIRLVKRIRSIPIGSRYLDDPVFRVEVSLYSGLFINLLYVVLKLVSGLYYRSVWFVSLSGYYVFLSVMRFSLLHHVRRSPIGQEYASELRRYRLCGILLLAMNLALSAIITLVVVWNQGFEYGEYLLYAMAAYTFYTMITSVINVIKFRRYNSPVLSAAKVINLTAAMVSMLSLETAMISQFGSEEGPVFRRAMTAVTGFAVCVIVIGMAVFMIVRANKGLKKLQSDE